MSEPINILDMIDNAPPVTTCKPCVLYGTGGFLIKAPEKFTRNEKLAFVEHSYKTSGIAADSDRFINEIRCSYGLSLAAFNKAREYGLYIFNKRG